MLSENSSTKRYCYAAEAVERVHSVVAPETYAVRGASPTMNKVACCTTQDLGLIRVTAAEAAMNDLRDLRARGAADDALLLLRHPKTVALGMRQRDSETCNDLLVPRDRLANEGIELVRSVRGGGITFHWPGQLICYPVIALGPDERDIPAYMRKIEEVGIAVFAAFGLEVFRRRDTAAHVGLWLGGRKIMSMGVRVSKWVTSFGFALNVAGDFSQSRYVRPCGIQDAELTTLEAALGREPIWGAVKASVIDNFGLVFERNMIEPSRAGYPTVESASRIV